MKPEQNTIQNWSALNQVKLEELALLGNQEALEELKYREYMSGYSHGYDDAEDIIRYCSTIDS